MHLASNDAASPICAADHSWHVQQWATMGIYVNAMPEQNVVVNKVMANNI